MFICHSANHSRQEGEKGKGGGVNLRIPQSSNMPSLNTLKSKHAKGQHGRDNQKIPSFYTLQEYQDQDTLFQPLAMSLIIPASDA